MFSDHETINANTVVRVLIKKELEFPTSFILDTGCPFTYISLVPDEYSAVSKLVSKKTYKTLNWGDRKIELLSLGNAELSMRTENGKITNLKLKSLFLARIEDIPESIMGLDFLRNEGIKLFLDPKHWTGYLQK